MDINRYLRALAEKGGSDLFITAGVPPSMKVNGKIMPITKTPMSPEQTRETVHSVMNEQQRREFTENHECNFAISARGIGRFRVSAFYQRNLAGMVLRRIETNIPTLEDLKLPEVLKKLAMTKRGLVLFVGATGTGKSTSLAAMIGYRNKNSSGHIISIEDPIEFIHQHQSCIVTQREVGIDTDSFDVALKNTLRQAPDVILIGEMRDRETAKAAIDASLTGHLVLSTLHTNSAPETITRLLGLDLDPDDFSEALVGVVAQRLVRKLCSDCKQPYHPTPDEVELLVRKSGDPNLLLTPASTLYKPKGWAECGNTGYRGRMAIHELLVSSDQIRDLINHNADVGKITRQALEEGMTTLLADGVSKILAGDLDYPQLQRVAAE